MERNVGVQFMCWSNVTTLWNELMFRRKRLKHWELLCIIFYTDAVLFLFVVCLTTMQIANLKWPWENLFPEYFCFRRSQWSRGLRHRSLAARLLRLWVRIPPGAWIFVCCECCVLSGRGLCDGLIIRPGESYRMWRVVCDQETSQARRLKPTRGL